MPKKSRLPKLTPHPRRAEDVERRERGDTLMDIARTNGVARTQAACRAQSGDAHAPKRCERQSPTPNVNAFTYAARPHQHNASRQHETSAHRYGASDQAVEELLRWSIMRLQWLHLYGS
jgi:hypothetical protein